MIRLPLSWVQILIDVGLLRRPDFLMKDVGEAPDELAQGFVFREVRGVTRNGFTSNALDVASIFRFS